MYTGGICLQNLMGNWCVVRTEMNGRFERNKFPVPRFNSDTTKHFSVDGLEATFRQNDFDTANLDNSCPSQTASDATCHRSFMHKISVGDCFHIACQRDWLAVQRNRLSADVECYGIADTCFNREYYRLRGQRL